MAAPHDQHTILIVDDIPSNLEVVVGRLEEAGFAVVVAQDGEEALARAALVVPDLILLDVLMPGMNGFETCRRLKVLEATRDIPVIFMTALTDVRDKLAGFEAGGVDYVTKPFDIAEVLARANLHLTLRVLQRRLEQQNEQLRIHEATLERQVAERTAELERTNARLREAIRVREEFFSVASHELNTPTASLLLSTQSLLEFWPKHRGSDGKPDPASGRIDPGFIDPGFEVAIQRIHRQARRLSRLVSDLLDVSRIEAGRLAMSFEDDVDLAEIVREAISHLELDLKRAGSPVVVEGNGPVHGRWDRSRMLQAITNLLSNAIKFGAGKSIVVSFEEDGDLARFSVSDHGIGMDADVMSRLFQRYARGVSAEHYGGLGLGLFICKTIVDAHGGAIAVESSPDHGSRFTVELPRMSKLQDATREDATIDPKAVRQVVSSPLGFA